MAGGRPLHRLIVSLSLCFAIFAVSSIYIVADAAQPAAPVLLPDQKLSDELAKSWTAFYAGKYDEAAKLAEPLSKPSEKRFVWAAVEALHIKARCLWAKGTGASRFEAQKIWQQLEKTSTLDSLLVRLKIAKALELEAAGDAAKLALGIEQLEQILKDNQRHTGVPEAALDLARLYTKARRFDDAKKALDFAVALMSDKGTIAQMEITDSLANVYVQNGRTAIGQLAYAKDAGRAEFEAAEALYRAQKFAGAIPAYQAVAKGFPDTDYAPRSEYMIGNCHLGLQKIDAALEHWKKFVSLQPSGPWRGQVFVAMLDIYLEEQLDLANASKYADLASGAFAEAIAGEKSAASWKTVAGDVQLRIGLIQLLQNKYAAAVDAFEQGKKLGSKTPLDAMIAAAQSEKAIIPEDTIKRAAAGQAADKASLALSLGMYHFLAGRSANADLFFDRVLGTSGSKAKAVQGAAPEQKSFATFGKGMVLQANKKTSEARDQFIASFKAHSAGSWHDETMYRIALISQDEAEGKMAAKPGKDGKPDPSAEKTNNRESLSAKRTAYTYWKYIIDKYPQSPRCEQAYFYTGIILYDLTEAGVDTSGKQLTAAGTEQAWKDTSTALGKFCETYPKSQWAGDVFIKLIDAELERMFDIDMARPHALASTEWAKASAKAKLEDLATEVWRLTVKPIETRPYLYQIYLKAGLVAYLDQKYDDAQELFELAKPLAPPRKLHVVSGKIPTGIEVIIEASKRRLTLTPPDALDARNKKASLVLQLADLYDISEDFEKSFELAEIVINGKVEASHDQKSWATFRRGRANYRKDREHRDVMAAKKDYLTAVRMAPNSTWAYKGLFYAGNIAFNTEKDIPAAVALWQRLITEYPKSAEAHRAAYYIGVAYEVSKQPAKARDAYENFLKSYPDSPFVELVNTEHLKNVSDMQKERKK